MPTTPPPTKPKRIKSILDYLQQDVPKTGDNEESVPGEGESTDQPVPVNGTAYNDDAVKRKPRPKFFA